MYFMSDPQALHVTRNVIPGKLGVDLHLHRVHIPLVLYDVVWHIGRHLLPSWPVAAMADSLVGWGVEWYGNPWATKGAAADF